MAVSMVQGRGKPFVYNGYWQPLYPDVLENLELPKAASGESLDLSEMNFASTLG